MSPRLLGSGSFGALVLLWCAAPSPCLSQAPSPANQPRHADLGIALRFGTPGFGLEVNKLLMNHLGVRAGVNYFSVSTTQTQSDIRYDATLKLQAVTALLDVFPSSRGSFHLTGGLITNPAKVTAKGKPTAQGNFEINGNTYTTAQVGTLRGEGKFPGVSPYLGLGWGTAARGNHALGFLFDLGVGIGKATISLTASGAATNPALASDLEAQERKTEKDVQKWAKVYPVLSFGLVYRL